MESSRNCAGCGFDKAESFFSLNQWGKGPGLSRCSTCVAARNIPRMMRSSSSLINNAPEEQRCSKKHKFKCRTPSTPVAETQFTWEIENLDQLLLKKSHEQPWAKWSRRSKLATLWFDKEDEGASSNSTPSSKQIKFCMQIVVEEKDGGIRDVGCFIARVGDEGFIYLQQMELVLPDGSIKKKVASSLWRDTYTASADREREWLGWTEFLSKGVSLNETGLHQIGDGGVILRLKAKILKEGWIPRQPNDIENHNFGEEDDEETHSSVGLAIFENAEFSDIRLVCQQERSFRCHRAILSAWSPVFKAMFSHSEMAEGRTNEVVIQDIKPPVMEALLKFMYCGHLQCELGDELDLLAAAQKYSVKSIKKLCETRLIGALKENPCNVPQILSLTSLHCDLKCLHYTALQCLNEHRHEVMSSDGWKLLCKQAPAVALEYLNEAEQKFGRNKDVENCTCTCWEK